MPTKQRQRRISPTYQIGKPSQPLTAVLPYLATLSGVIAYNPHKPAVTLRRQPGFMILSAEEVSITQVKDTDEGLKLLAALTAAINCVWERREELTPLAASRRPPQL